MGQSPPPKTRKEIQNETLNKFPTFIPLKDASTQYVSETYVQKKKDFDDWCAKESSQSPLLKLAAFGPPDTYLYTKDVPYVPSEKELEIKTKIEDEVKRLEKINIHINNQERKILEDAIVGIISDNHWLFN
jgi:hypothetical protein